jgi:hypothetical protein
VKEQVFASAILELARKYGLREEHIPSMMPGRHLTAAEQRLFGELTREPVASAAFKSGRQTDLMPQFQFATAAG